MRNFSDIPIVPQGINPEPEAAKRYLNDTITDLAEILDRGLRRWDLSTQENRMLDSLLGHSGHNCLASNLTLRRDLGRRLVDILAEMETANPGRRFWLVTLISDRWLSFDRYCRIWLGGMKAAARQVMAMGGFCGWFGFIEVQTLDHTTSFFGRILMPHAHFIAWSDHPSFDHAGAEARMASSGRLESRTGARTVVVNRDLSTSTSNLAAYIMKAGGLAKRREVRSTRPGDMVLRDCSLPPVSAIRQVEILSQMTFDELMLGGAQGTAVRSELVKLVYRRPPRATEPDSAIAARFWMRVRSRLKSRKYEPVLIDRSTRQLPSGSPIGLACANYRREDWVVHWLLACGRLDSSLPAWIEILVDAVPTRADAMTTTATIPDRRWHLLATD